MNNGPFVPKGSTYLVGTSEVQVLTAGQDMATSYRIRNCLTTTQYLKWAPPLPTGGSVSITVTAPTAGNPQPNTIGFFPGAIEMISFPANAWFKADAVGAFEITPGEGL